ncbi:type IV secretory system conjugative DNA transfer family protein [Pseudomonas fluorescens]|uniref:Type IV secretory system conjugative DNA transfer family protein n=2 Tax=Pseudomonas fluorescens TaxID=294 RepID=A0A944DL76_PSEFL|nr:type IV secretory system conjugative DNA transfer family protein [Pseudomonas fluorescens]MBT2316778.1 type IV secretory system conjugative DNA transfer family protein [Pseudomonas fluorescens]MBT2329793.1 type IV secretory system conjugative DNA transfer family protein [Pseudomonas fluorescens]MBT2344597.1 type IV secretory system conjugative DNA transfer family protein [Pseudomonas fluorescens]MBT2348013.1 type IV secretory system conjugative DNA transfer family protein [Pseudomonas fluore
MRLEDIATSRALSYDPGKPGKKVLIGALGKQLIGIEDDRHILTVAGSRSGKSVGLISNLFFYPGSILATDPKGELADITADRRAGLGQKIYVVDPFGVSSKAGSQYRASYNPMSILTIFSGTFLEDAALIAESIVVQSADQKDPHWDESAKNFIEGVIIHVATAPQYTSKCHLITVRELIKRALWIEPGDDEDSKAGPAMPLLYEEMMNNAYRLQEHPTAEDIGSAIMAAALDFYGKKGNEISGVHSTVNRHTKFLDYSAFRKVLKEHDFDLAELKRNPAGVSIYLCFPATRIEISRRWMRVFVNQLLDAMEREKKVPLVPVLACLDEFPVLGYMKQLETASGLIASFGVKLWVIIQDWSQGKALYGERWETFAGNAGILQFFGNNDLATTEYTSKLLGKTQVEVARTGEVAQDQQHKGLSGRSEAIELYDLMTPDEIRRHFSRSDALKRQRILWAGRHPMMLQRAVWHQKDGVLAPYL